MESKKAAGPAAGELAGGASLTFKRNALGTAEVFRTPYSGGLVFCSRRLKDEVLQRGIGGSGSSRGLRFTDGADI
ncbi:DUF1629 domain-containing protein [Stenotrophomonas sp. SAU14A_NAIMI4_5]|uniref:imm11 family protein n=1 Tax=Stenotrophomonas sp. SAU14A_NAIMI4_5 TaxID=2072413 RepID=UPI0031B60A89